MITLYRQRYRYWFRLISIIIISAFLSQDMAWASYIHKKQYLAPNSEFAKIVSVIDLEMAGIGYTFIRCIKESNIKEFEQLVSYLNRNIQIRKDLYHININTIFYQDRIELIGPKFTLAFLDATKYPKEGVYQIPGTNIRMDLYKHPHLLQPSESKDQRISITSPDRAIITDKNIPGMNIIPLLKSHKIAVIEISLGNHLPYAGNFIKKMQEQNEVQFFTIENPDELIEKLYSFCPDIVFLPENNPRIDHLIKNCPFENILFYYESLEKESVENVYLSIPEEDLQVGIRAIQEYKSQIERTRYHEIAELFVKYNGKRFGVPYAHPFVATEIENGELKDIDLTLRYCLDIPYKMPLITVSPHIDDMAIGLFGLVRSKLRNTQDDALGVIDIVFAYSERGVLKEGTLEEMREIRIAEDKNAKRVLSEGTPGRIETEYLGFDINHDSQYQQNLQKVIDYLNEFIEQDISVALPHPEDSHPTHRKTTNIALEALKRISKEKGIRINILFYKTPWSENYNTFYVSSEDTSGNEIAELGKRAFTRTVGELAGGDFAVKSPSPEEFGGEFTERFRRIHHIPKKYIEGIDNKKLDNALSKERLVQSHSGIRINYGERRDTLTDTDKVIACLYAYNYLKFIYNNITQHTGQPPKNLQFVIGHDPRPTAGALLETQIRGFLTAAKELDVELEIINLGMLPKPMYQNAVRSFKANGGVYLTASHNELTWNGLEYATKYKMEEGFTFGGSLLNAEESRELIKGFSDSISKIRAGDLAVITEINNTWPIIEVNEDKYTDAKNEYKRFILEKFGRVTGVKVVLDPNGGAGCGIYKEILEELGFNMIEINGEISKPGHKIDPEKDPQCYTRLAQIIKRENALFGMTFDYDGDRGYLTILDPSGNLQKISPQDTAAINVALVLQWCKTNGRFEGQKTAIVVNDATSGRVKEIVGKFGVDIFYVETGETNLVNKMHELRKEGYYVPVAIEGSNGGTIFFDSMCRDGILSTISVALEKTNPELQVEIPKYYTELDVITDLDISIKDLKIRLEEYIRQNLMGFTDYEVHYFEGTNHIINRTKIPGSGMTDETGGWKLVLKSSDGKEHFIWLRPSKTEPNITRIEFDSPSEVMITKLKRIFHQSTISNRCNVSSDYDKMSRRAAEYFVKEVTRLIEEKGKAVVCLATGDTTKAMYRIIREEYKDAIDWSKVITFNLDEYVFSQKKYPLEKHPYSFRYFMEKELFKHVPISEENTHFINENDPFAEDFYIEQFLEEIRRAGDIDLCILGIGENGHIAFNEPGSAFNSTTRRVKLAKRTRWVNRKTFGKWWQFWRFFKVPRYALTMGIQDIMNSHKIMLLACGKDKTSVIQKALYEKITLECPASILQTHLDVKYFLDEEVFTDDVGNIGYEIFEKMPKPNFLKRISNINWWRDKVMFAGMQFKPLKKLLMRLINRYPVMPLYKKIPLFWFGIGLRFIAPRFIAGGSVGKVTGNIIKLRKKGICFTADILGEDIKTEEEAEENKKQYIKLLEDLAKLAPSWEPIHILDKTPRVNLSLKLTALVSRLDEEHKEIVKERLRETLRKAIGFDAFITIDMEQYCYKDITLEIYKELLEEDEFKKCGKLQIVIQTYLKDSPKDIMDLIEWAKDTGANASIRLVKGAYWDKEVKWAKEEGRQSPVWYEKWQSDKNYEDMTAMLLKNHQYINTVFATHNVRSMARVIYEARKNNIPNDEIEFQMLYGMGELFQDALVSMGYRVRAYVPFGPLLKGIKYFSRRIEENTSQESFLLQSLSGRYPRDELLKAPRPKEDSYKERFNSAFNTLLSFNTKDFIPDRLKERLENLNKRKRIKYYSFSSLSRLKWFCRLWRINPDRIIVIKLILPEKYGKRIIITALRFGVLKKELFKREEEKEGHIIKMEKTLLWIERYFSLENCEVKGEGLYLNPEWQGEGLGKELFTLFIQRLIESGLGGYPYKTQVENPKLLHFLYKELNAGINTTNTGLTQNFIGKFEKKVGGQYPEKISEFKEDPKGKARKFLEFLISLFKQGVSLDWGYLRVPVEGIIPEDVKSLEGYFDRMVSSAKMLEEYIKDGRIIELIPEWEDWVKLYENLNFKYRHHVSPVEHIVLAFKRIESDYFKNIIARDKLTTDDIKCLRIALLLHDFGKIAILQKDPSYSSQVNHPIYSAEMAEKILLGLGYKPDEVADALLLIRYHSVLKDLGEHGEVREIEIQPMEFVNSLGNIRNLKLLRLLQLVDAASVRHEFGNSLSMGLERRVNEITDMIESILVSKAEKSKELEKKFLEYLADIKSQNGEIGEAFKRFKDVLLKHNIEIPTETLNEAFLAMHRSHLGQLRKDGITPFTVHPIEVAILLVDELGIKNPNWIIATLLHDVLEDTRTTRGAIENIFGKEGKEIADIVTLLSKIDLEPYSSEDERDRKFYFRLIYGTNGIKGRGILTAAQTIKMADRIYNLRTLETKDPKFPKKQIDETYDIFIHYFLGETEVSVDIKRALIRELINSNTEWKVLTPEQVGMLKSLSREIVEFKIPDVRIEESPYNFIRGLINFKQQEKPDTPPVFAFAGMSGVGRTTFTENLKEQLQRVGIDVVVFDTNDYLILRDKRDKVLQHAKEARETYYEQRERLYNFNRFKSEVLEPLGEFRASTELKLELKLSGLYNRLTGKLGAKKSYKISRNTVILIEGIHVLQEEFLQFYDSTFLVYAPPGVCLENVLLREKQKPKKYQQPEQKIRERFKLLDWPSYRKHWVEYWLASGYIIDNTDYSNPLTKINPFPMYPQKAPSISRELVNSQARLNKNLSNQLKQLESKGILPYDIVCAACDHINLFRNLLVIKDIATLIPKNMHIPLPEETVDSLNYFLDQLIYIYKTDIEDLFFRFLAAYILEEIGEEIGVNQGLLYLRKRLASLSIKNERDIKIFKDASEILKWYREYKVDPSILFNPSFPQDVLLGIVSKQKWNKVKVTPSHIVYKSDGLYLKVAEEEFIEMGEKERQFVYGNIILRFINSLLNRFYHVDLVRGFKEMIKRIIHWLKPQRIIRGKYLEGYRLILEKAPHLIVPTRIVSSDSKILIVQIAQGKLLIDYIKDLLERDEWGGVDNILEKAFLFLQELWQYGLADVDIGVNIFNNLVVTEKGEIKIVDADAITNDFNRVKNYCAQRPREFLTYFGEEKAGKLAYNKLVDKFNTRNLESHWKWDDFINQTLEGIRKHKPKVVVFYNRHYPLEPLGDVVQLIKDRYPPLQILFVEFPYEYTPLGYALNSYEFLYSISQQMASGNHILKNYSVGENKEFGDLLLRFLEEVKNKAKEISSLHESGLKDGQGKARQLVAKVMDGIIQEITKKSKIDFNLMLKALAQQNPSLRDEEELVVKKLVEQYPGLHFISLHGQFISVSTHFEHEWPYNYVYGTKKASQHHIPLIKKTIISGKIPKWGFVRASFGSEYLRSQLNLPYFDNNISYAFFELPIFPYPEYSSPMPKDELIKAIIGSYLLQDPYFATAKNERYMDMDYFRVTPLSPESRDSIASNLIEYLDLFLKQIEETPVPIEEEIPRGMEIPIEEALKLLRLFMDREIDIPLPYVKGFSEFGNRLLQYNELDVLIRLIGEYLSIKPPEYKIIALKRKDSGLLVEKVFQELSTTISRPPPGSPSECLKALFSGRHFSDNPITLDELGKKRINPKTNKPYNKKTVNIELKGLIILGLVKFQRAKRGRYEYFLLDGLQRAPPEAIDEIYNISLSTPPHKAPLLGYNEVSKLSKDELEELRNKIREKLRLSEHIFKTFRERIVSLMSNAVDLIDLDKPERQEQTRQDIKETLKGFTIDTSQDKLTQSMAWHTLEGLGMNEEFKGKVVYSLKTILESNLNDGNRTEKLKKLIESTKGRVVFYAGNGYINNPEYDFLKGSLVTIDGVTELIKGGELIVFMLNEEHREELGIVELPIGQLSCNQLFIPIKGARDVETDILLGLEIIRNSGKISEMPSLFKMLLIKAIREWLTVKGEMPTEERIQEILQIEIPEPQKDYLKDIEHSYTILSSV